MDNILFSVGDQPVTLAWALLGGFVLVTLALLTLIIVVLRTSGGRSNKVAQAVADTLRQNLDQKISERDERIDDLEKQLAQKRDDNVLLQTDAAALRTEMEVKQLQTEQNLARFHNARQQMTDEFKVIATEILDNQGKKFSSQNREQIDNLLKPLREKINEFQKQTHEGGARLALQLGSLTEDSLRMSTEANNLTRALKGSAQTQGAWGEMILSTILEKSGLREGEQFFTQQSHTTETGARLRTDVEVLFPNGQRLVVDSKVSLTAFEALTNCEDEDERNAHLRNHITSLKTHIKTLGDKDYQRHAKSGLNYVMMFVPIEAAFSVAMNEESGLIDYAIRRNVYITTPTTLMVALRTVANVWDTEKRNQNAEQIADRAGALYDKVAGFLGNMDKLEKSLGTAQKSFDEAKSQLVSGRGSVVRQIEMLKELGAKNPRPMPDGWDDGKTDEPTQPGLLPTNSENSDAE